MVQFRLNTVYLICILGIIVQSKRVILDLTVLVGVILGITA